MGFFGGAACTNPMRLNRAHEVIGPPVSVSAVMARAPSVPGRGVFRPVKADALTNVEIGDRKPEDIA